MLSCNNLSVIFLFIIHPIKTEFILTLLIGQDCSIQLALTEGILSIRCHTWYWGHEVEQDMVPDFKKLM